MVGHGGSSAGSYLANPTSPIPSHCASVVATSTLKVKSSYRFYGYVMLSIVKDKEASTSGLHFYGKWPSIELYGYM